jgi:hypothetical protein
MTEKMQIEVGASVGGAVTGLRQVGSEMKKLTPNANAGTRAFTDFGRVLQDLPFGPTGIANNLEAIAFSMRNVKEQAKAAGTSVGSVLVKSLMGGGGLMLALSAVSFALTFAQSGLLSWTRMFGGASSAANSHTNALKKQREALQDYVDSLDDLTGARVRGSQSAQEELVKLRTLYEASQNINVPLKKRKELVDELQEQYPKYFANIKDETILAGGAEKAYNSLSAAILESARARAAQDTLVDIQKQVLANESQLVASTQEQAEVYRKIVDLKRTGGKLVETSLTGEERLTASGAKMNRLQDAYNDKNKATNELISARTDLLKRAERLSMSISDAVVDNPDALLSPTAKPTKPKVDKKQFDFLFDFFPFDPSGKLKPEEKTRVLSAIDNFSKDFGKIFDGVDFRIKAKDDDSAIKAAKIWWDNYKNGIVKFAQSEGLEVDVKLVPTSAEVSPEEAAALRKQYIDGLGRALNKEGQPPIVITPELQADFDDFKKKLDNEKKVRAAIQDNVNDAAKGISVAGFVSVGEAIAAAITGGNVGTIFQQLGQTIGAVVQQLGAQMIALSPVIQALKVAITALKPAGILAAGIGLVALGGIIKGATKVKGFAAGGLVYGPTMGLVGEGIGTSKSNPEVIAPLDKLKNIIGGGGSFPDYLPAWELRGDTLRAWYAKAEKKGGQFI